MARRYGILQKKVEELESEVGSLLVLRNIQSHDEFDKTIKGKFAFARRLLSAEMQLAAVAPYSAHNGKQPQHLHHIESRLVALEAAFLSWRGSSRSSEGVRVDASFACSCNDCSDGVEDEPEMGGDFGWLIDVSWEEDFLLGNRVVVEEEDCLQTLSSKELEKAKLDASAAEEEKPVVVGEERAKKGDEKRWCSSSRKSFIRVFLFGVLVGAATAVVRFSGEGHFQSEEVFLLPT